MREDLLTQRTPQGAWGRRLVAAIALLGGLVACAGDRPADPGAGTLAADLATDGTLINLDTDGGKLFALLIDGGGSELRFVVAQVEGPAVTRPLLAPVDWSDYAASIIAVFMPTLTARVSGGKAWFLGRYGLTVAPLDGSPAYQLFPPSTPPYPGPSYDTLDAFAVDEGSAYLCYGDTRARAAARLGRFRPDGTWEVLFAAAAPWEDCSAGGFAADPEHVYWATTDALRAYRKSDGQVAVVVNLTESRLTVAPWQLAVAGDKLVWLDETGIHAAPKSLETRAADSAVLARLGPSDPMVFSMLVDGASVYWMTQTGLWRAPLTGGASALLAHRASPPGVFLGLAAQGEGIYFSNSVPVGANGYRLELRSVPR